MNLGRSPQAALPTASPYIQIATISVHKGGGNKSSLPSAVEGDLAEHFPEHFPERGSSLFSIFSLDGGLQWEDTSSVSAPD